jgi:hypothetical protein
LKEEHQVLEIWKEVTMVRLILQGGASGLTTDHITVEVLLFSSSYTYYIQVAG